MTDKTFLDLDTTDSLNSSDRLYVSQGGDDKTIPASALLEGISKGTPFKLDIKEETSTNRILTSSDDTGYISFINTSPSSVVVPPQSQVNWKRGAIVYIKNSGNGVSISSGVGVVVNASASGLSLTEPNQIGALVRVKADEWDFVTGGVSLTQFQGAPTSLTVATLVQGVSTDGSLLDFATLASTGTPVETTMHNSTSKVGSAKYIIKTLAQAVLDGDVIDGTQNLQVGGGSYVAIKSKAEIHPYSASGFDLFVVYGQSNSVGYAQNTAGFPGNVYNINSYFDNSANELRPIKKSIQSSSGDTSSGHAWQAFANEYTRLTGRYVIMLQCALGGSTIDDLKQGSTAYNQMLNSVNALDTYCTSNNVSINKRSVLWHQGESDMSGGTLHNDYISTLAALAVDIRTDLDTDKFYIARVGCPQNRTEQSWYAIQSAQDFICQSFDYFVMSYSDCGSFTSGNGMLRDGVHYTQNGYNSMGIGIAGSVAKSISEPSPHTGSESSQYNTLMTTPDQIWRHTFAALEFNSGSFSIFDKDDSDSFRAVNTLSSEISGGDLLVTIQSRANYIIDLKASLNEVAEKYGFRVTVSLTGNGNSVWALRVSFYKDVSFLLSLDTGSISNPYYPTGLPTQPWLSSISSTFISSNYYRVNHPWIDAEAAPVVTPVFEASVAPDNTTPVYVLPESVSNGAFRVRTSVSTGAKALVRINNCKIDAGDLLDGMIVHVSATVAAKKL